MMEQTDRRDHTDRNGQKDRCTAILLAAGKGLRMGGDTRKQYLDLEGRPLFTYSISVMENSDIITDIVITVPEGDEEFCGKMVESFGLGKKVRKIIAGGSERYFSVNNGLQAIDWPCDYVFIHDSARPFIDDEAIGRLYDEVRIHKACVAGMPAKDTIKISDEDGFVQNTPDRRYVWIIQTPQVFDYALIKGAYEKMVGSYDDLCGKGVNVTDDAMVVEFFTGCKVKLVKASYRNIKVTTPEDIATAFAYLKEKK